jgi:hypothetical protein
VPLVIVRTFTVPQDVEIPVVGPYLEERITRTAPPIEQLLDKVIALAEPKAHWTFVCFVPGVALHTQ